MPMQWTRRSVLSGIGSTATAFASPSGQDLIVSVADFGVLPGIHDAGPGVRSAIATFDKRPGSTLHFPPGTYRFGSRDGVAMLFDDMDHLTLEGKGATLLFNGAIAPVLMRGCRAPTVKGLEFDWERPPFSQGEIIAVGPDRKSLILRIDPQFPVDGSERIQQLGTYDRTTQAVTVGGIDDGSSIRKVSLVGMQTLHLELNRPLGFKPGDTVVARHGNGLPVINLQDCQDFNVESVAIYAGPMMAIAIGGCDNGTIRSVRVEQKPGTSRIMSTNEDALHCASCSGTIRVEDSTFTGMGDDGINVTGLYLAVATENDQRTLTLSGGHYSPAPSYTSPNIGDHLLIVSGQTLRPLADLEVQAVTHKENGRWSVTVPPIHPTLDVGPVFAIDLQARTHLTVSKCKFGGNRARGVLAHSDAVIENCIFENQSDSAILLAPDLYWQEGPAIERMVVRNNHIQDSNLLKRGPAAVWVSAFVAPAGHQGTPTVEVVNKDVVIEGNRFQSPNGAAVAVACTRNVHVTNNRIDRASSTAFDFRNVLAVRLEHNHCDPVAKIRVDQASVAEVEANGNSGLEII